MSDQLSTAACHCGRPVHVYNDLDGFTRDLCLECSTVRCDVEPDACRPASAADLVLGDPFARELWEGACISCAAHWRQNAASMRHALASVGIERGKSSFHMARDYYTGYHERGHKEAFDA